jgi:hypothetical protein
MGVPLLLGWEVVKEPVTKGRVLVNEKGGILYFLPIKGKV